MKKFLVLSLHLLITSFLFAQAPQGIPYQAVMRNADGSVLANSVADMTFMIHEGSAEGTVVYQESHALTSNAQGLVSCVVGNGVVSQGNFANINWGSGAKFLQVMMGTTDLGTQQMLSVPYALYAGACDISVSQTGDTLFSGNGNFVIIPGISAANFQSPIYTSIHSCGINDIHNVNLPYGEALDQENNVYKTIVIGNQTWFAENLKTSVYRNGDAIATGLNNMAWQTTSSGAYCYYNDLASNNCPYGKLYNWYVISDSRGICPTGWHVPSNQEWIELRNYLGGDLNNVGGMMKSTGVSLWNTPNSGATNQSGFSSIPGGARQSDGVYNWLGYSSNYWTSNLNGSTAFFRNNVAINSGIYESFVEGDLHGGISIRCIKDSNLGAILGCMDASACNFLANATQDDGSCLYQNATCDDGNANTTNDVINANCQCAGIATGNGVFVPGNGVTDIDGTVYTSIVINGQEWMQQNLAVAKYRNGDPIPTGFSGATWSSTTSGAYTIYNNDPANNATYGKLYNWYAATDSRGLCPTGWHVPSDAEWTTLEMSLGGSSVAGGKMKSTTGWNAPNTGATNESGFSGLPGGYRYFFGSYDAIGYDGYWWSSSEYSFDDAWGRGLYHSGSNGYGTNYVKLNGFSVRCVRD